MKPSRSTRVQDKTCFAGDDLILFISTRQTILDYFCILNRHVGFRITVLKITNLDIFGSPAEFLTGISCCTRLPRDDPWNEQDCPWIPRDTFS